MDETGLSPNHKPVKVLDKRGSKTVHSKTSNSKEMLTRTKKTQKPKPGGYFVITSDKAYQKKLAEAEEKKRKLEEKE
ncbi:hypothetical protein KUTeg_017207 [Tegillarca granosa]|uniref:Uncharacterized protein n=1 Tax=Tegillarca granosa TaxID=220873 RepID=A0ABQ9EJ18_TEGGR|nr:hypothetical protein KUTeg_017207 [Tegillarca granosa]